MFNKLRMKLAARRVKRKNDRRAKKTAATGRTATNRRGIGALWARICKVDLIGLLNLTLLVAIIAIFTMLIIDILNCRRPQLVVVPKNTPTTEFNIAHTTKSTKTPAPNMRTVKPRPHTKSLPIRRDASTRMYATEPVNIVAIKQDPVIEQQTVRRDKNIYGDTIIDGRGAAHILRAGDTVNGNLYLQNMRKYTLPCGVTVRGNLFLRDLNWLQFCGDFTVTGNIYVSPRSSFGPLPRTARIGGHLIF